MQSITWTGLQILTRFFGSPLCWSQQNTSKGRPNRAGGFKFLVDGFNNSRSYSSNATPRVLGDIFLKTNWIPFQHSSIVQIVAFCSPSGQVFAACHPGTWIRWSPEVRCLKGSLWGVYDACWLLWYMSLCWCSIFVYGLWVLDIFGVFSTRWAIVVAD